MKHLKLKPKFLKDVTLRDVVNRDIGTRYLFKTWSELPFIIIMETQIRLKYETSR